MSKKNKCKLISKRGATQFVMYSAKGQQLNEREVYTINNQSVEGLLQFATLRKGSGYEFIYNLNGLITLRDFLINPLNREAFGRILQNILNVLKEMQKVYFNPKCLLMDFERVMVNPATQKLQFIYVPLQEYDANCELRVFLLDLIQKGTFVKEEDSNYVREYIRILNNGINFSVFELEEYIRGLLSESGYRLEKNINCFKCGTQLTKGNNYCSVCGAKIVSNAEQISNLIYNPLDNHKDDSKIMEESEKKKAPTKEERNSGTQGLSDFDKTSLLGMYESMYEENIYLIREKTGEKIQISKETFRLGRSVTKCDYAISDNIMVGRTHADIIRLNQGYAIRDLESVNKTYVNNYVVINEQEIHSGDKIKLANELFTFCIEKG